MNRVIMSLPKFATPWSLLLFQLAVSTEFLFSVMCIYIVTNSRVLFHDGSLLHSKFNTQLLIKISNSSRILTHV
jgi:hypothetical protein